MGKKKQTISIDSVLNKIDRGEVSPVYLLYGKDMVKIYESKDRIVPKLIPESVRDQNLKEFYTSSTRPLSLSSIINDIIDELLTIPFMFESKKVVVVYDPIELKKPKRKNKSKVKVKTEKDSKHIVRFCNLIDNLTSSTIMIIIFSEDDAKQKEINESSKIFKKIDEKGLIIQLGVSNLLFDFVDFLLQRKCSNSIQTFRELVSSGQDPNMFLGFLISSIRLLYQTKILLFDKKDTNLQKYLSEADSLPANGKQNILKQSEYRMKKFIGFSNNFTMKELDEYYEKLFELDMKLNPTQLDIYAPDPLIGFEQFIVDFCEKR